MNLVRKLTTLNCLLLVAGAFLLAGCQKGGFRENGTGTDVSFRASTSQSNTKAAYSGQEYPDGGKTYERIDWEGGDVLRIYSNEASHRYLEQNWADYVVKAVTSPIDRYSSASIAPSGSSGLVWGDPGTYHFYGVYPASATGAAGESGFSFSGAIDADQGQWNASANKIPQYGYMAAVASAEVSEDDSDAPVITLDFYPYFSSFDVDLKSKDREITVTKFELLSDVEALAGPFSVSFAGTTKTIDCSSATDKTVSVTFAQGTTISTTQELRFTVFALPQDLTKLSIRFTILSDDPTQTQTHTLKLAKKIDGELNYLTFEGCKKHKITGLQMEGAWNFKTITLTGEVIEWTEEEVEVESDNMPQASQFEVTGEDIFTVYELHPSDANRQYRQTWVLGNKTATVSFKIFSPVGGTYEIVPQGATDSFTVSGNLSGDINDRTDVSVTKVTFTVTPAGAAAGDEIWFKVFVTDSQGVQYSLDSETQLYDSRGYHKFRFDDPLQ